MKNMERLWGGELAVLKFGVNIYIIHIYQIFKTYLTWHFSPNFI